MILLLDLGNSRLKWSYTNNTEFQIVSALANSEITQSSLQLAWRDFSPHVVALSSVGKTELVDLICTTIRTLWSDIPIHIASTQKHELGVINGYVQPEKLGVDRWLALVAVWQKIQSTVCVVDCGTAVTIDVLNQYGEHQGGLICTGLSTMKNALASNTANLPFVDAHFQKMGLATETNNAIFNGALFAICGAIEKVMTSLPQSTQLFLTGGDAEIIASQLIDNFHFIVESNLVLQGLNTIYQHFHQPPKIENDFLRP